MKNEVAIIIVAAIGVLGTLSASFVGPLFQSKHERWKLTQEHNQLLREKAEELFAELERLFEDSLDAMIASINAVHGQAASNVPMPNLGKIHALARIYFPEIKPLIDEYESTNKKITEGLFADLDSVGGQVFHSALNRADRMNEERAQTRAFKISAATSAKQQSYETLVVNAREELGKRMVALK